MTWQLLPFAGALALSVYVIFPGLATAVDVLWGRK